MVEQELKNQILYMFRSSDFESMWYVCKKMYENLGFTDVTDQEKIDEYKWIVQQLRKYMFTKQDEIVNLNDLDEMMDHVELLIGRAEEYADERKKVVYNFMRDHWLLELRNHLLQLQLMTGEFVEPEDEEEE